MSGVLEFYLRSSSRQKKKNTFLFIIAEQKGQPAFLFKLISKDVWKLVINIPNTLQGRYIKYITYLYLNLCQFFFCHVGRTYCLTTTTHRLLTVIVLLFCSANNYLINKNTQLKKFWKMIVFCSSLCHVFILKQFKSFHKGSKDINESPYSLPVLGIKPTILLLWGNSDNHSLEISGTLMTH